MTRPVTLHLSIRYNFHRHHGQQVAVACWAMNAWCPFIGVCLSSFSGSADANLAVMKSMPWDQMVSVSLDWMYWRSLSVNLNRDRNLDFLRAVRAVGGVLVGHMGSVFGAAVPCAIGNIANDNHMFLMVCWSAGIHLHIPSQASPGIISIYPNLKKPLIPSTSCIFPLSWYDLFIHPWATVV